MTGHVLYPASIRLSRYIQENAKKLFPNNLSIKVLELGAGGGLPGLMCALSGASLLLFIFFPQCAEQVVTTNFPDPDLIKILEWNADEHLPASLRDRLIVKVSKMHPFFCQEVTLPFPLGALPESIESSTGTKLDGGLSQMAQTTSLHESTTSSPSTASSSSPGFDLLLLSDLVFNHSEHNSLLTTCEISSNNPAPMCPCSLSASRAA
ncbi:hypothetical protein MJO29_006111 [Puccinia striiformis f. sp. tritici]|nr:hypothetical protein MJO29_006111 [Puccinia striiformis f. sp. tritici]